MVEHATTSSQKRKHATIFHARLVRNCTLRCCFVNQYNNVFVDCQVSDWNKVYNCSTVCNEGYEIWSKTILVPPAYGGQGCPNLVENRTCNLDNPCPIGYILVKSHFILLLVLTLVLTDCEISNWIQISSCSVTCGDGYELWNKSILVENAYGGIPCPTRDLEETRVCKRSACIV